MSHLYNPFDAENEGSATTQYGHSSSQRDHDSRRTSLPNPGTSYGPSPAGSSAKPHHATIQSLMTLPLSCFPANKSRPPQEDEMRRPLDAQMSRAREESMQPPLRRDSHFPGTQKDSFLSTSPSISSYMMSESSQGQSRSLDWASGFKNVNVDKVSNYYSSAASSSFPSSGESSFRSTEERKPHEQSIPGLGNYDFPGQETASAQPKYTSELASNILLHFGLEKEDLEQLISYPEDQITTQNLPFILRQIRLQKTKNSQSAVKAEPYVEPKALTTVKEKDLRAHSHEGASHKEYRPPGILKQSKVIDYGHTSKYSAGLGDEMGRTSGSTSLCGVGGPGMLMDNSSGRVTREMKISSLISSRDQETSIPGLGSSYSSQLSSSLSTSTPAQQFQSPPTQVHQSNPIPFTLPTKDTDSRILPGLSKGLPLKGPESSQLQSLPPFLSNIPTQSSASGQHGVVLFDSLKDPRKPPGPAPNVPEQQLAKQDGKKPPTAPSGSTSQVTSATHTPGNIFSSILPLATPDKFPSTHGQPSTSGLQPPSRKSASSLPVDAQMYKDVAETPRMFPHTCSLCKEGVYTMKEWLNHRKSKLHQAKSKALLTRIPQTDGAHLSSLGTSERDVNVSTNRPRTAYKDRRSSRSRSRSPAPSRYHDRSSSSRSWSYSPPRYRGGKDRRETERRRSVSRSRSRSYSPRRHGGSEDQWDRRRRRHSRSRSRSYNRKPSFKKARWSPSRTASPPRHPSTARHRSSSRNRDRRPSLRRRDDRRSSVRRSKERRSSSEKSSSRQKKSLGAEALAQKLLESSAVQALSHQSDLEAVVKTLAPALLAELSKLKSPPSTSSSASSNTLKESTAKSSTAGLNSRTPKLQSNSATTTVTLQGVLPSISYAALEGMARAFGRPKTVIINRKLEQAHVTFEKPEEAEKFRKAKSNQLMGIKIMHESSASTVSHSSAKEQNKVPPIKTQKSNMPKTLSSSKNATATPTTKGKTPAANSKQASATQRSATKTTNASSLKPSMTAKKPTASNTSGKPSKGAVGSITASAAGKKENTPKSVKLSNSAKALNPATKASVPSDPSTKTSGLLHSSTKASDPSTKTPDPSTKASDQSDMSTKVSVLSDPSNKTSGLLHSSTKASAPLTKMPDLSTKASDQSDPSTKASDQSDLSTKALGLLHSSTKATDPSTMVSDLSAKESGASNLSSKASVPSNPSTKVSDQLTKASDPSAEVSDKLDLSTKASSLSAKASDPSTVVSGPSDPSNKTSGPSHSSTKESEPSTQASDLSTKGSVAVKVAGPSDPSSKASDPSTKASDLSTKASDPSIKTSGPSHTSTKASDPSTKASSQLDPPNKTSGQLDPSVKAEEEVTKVESTAPPQSSHKQQDDNNVPETLQPQTTAEGAMVPEAAADGKPMPAAVAAPLTKGEMMGKYLQLKRIACLSIKTVISLDFAPKDKRVLHITNLPKYQDDGYTEQDLADLLAPFGLQRENETTHNIYIIPQKRIAFVVLPSFEMLHSIVHASLKNSLDFFGTKLCAKIMRNNFSTPLDFYSALMHWMNVKTTPNFAQNLIFIKNITPGEARNLRDTLKKIENVKIYAPLLNKVFVEFESAQDADRLGIWYSLLRHAPQHHVFRLDTPRSLPNAKPPKWPLRAIPTIHERMLGAFVPTSENQMSTCPRLFSPFYAPMKVYPFVFPTASPWFIIPASHPKKNTMYGSLVATTLMFTSLPEEGYTQRDLALLVWPWLWVEDRTFYTFNYRVVVLPLQRRAFIFFEDMMLCNQFVRQHGCKPFTIHGQPIKVSFVRQNIELGNNEVEMYRSMMKLSNFRVPFHKVLIKRLLLVHVSEVSIELIQAVIKEVTSVVGQVVGFLPLGNRICIEMRETPHVSQVLKSLTLGSGTPPHIWQKVGLLESAVRLRKRMDTSGHLLFHLNQFINANDCTSASVLPTKPSDPPATTAQAGSKTSQDMKKGEKGAVDASMEASGSGGPTTSLPQPLNIPKESKPSEQPLDNTKSYEQPLEGPEISEQKAEAPEPSQQSLESLGSSGQHVEGSESSEQLLEVLKPPVNCPEGLKPSDHLQEGPTSNHEFPEDLKTGQIPGSLTPRHESLAKKEAEGSLSSKNILEGAKPPTEHSESVTAAENPPQGSTSSEKQTKCATTSEKLLGDKRPSEECLEGSKASEDLLADPTQCCEATKSAKKHVEDPEPSQRLREGSSPSGEHFDPGLDEFVTLDEVSEDSKDSSMQPSTETAEWTKSQCNTEYSTTSNKSTRAAANRDESRSPSVSEKRLKDSRTTRSKYKSRSPERWSHRKRDKSRSPEHRSNRSKDKSRSPDHWYHGLDKSHGSEHRSHHGKDMSDECEGKSPSTQHKSQTGKEESPGTKHKGTSPGTENKKVSQITECRVNLSKDMASGPKCKEKSPTTEDEKLPTTEGEKPPTTENRMPSDTKSKSKHEKEQPLKMEFKSDLDNDEYRGTSLAPPSEVSLEMLTECTSEPHKEPSEEGPKETGTSVSQSPDRVGNWEEEMEKYQILDSFEEKTDDHTDLPSPTAEKDLSFDAGSFQVLDSFDDDTSVSREESDEVDTTFQVLDSITEDQSATDPVEVFEQSTAEDANKEANVSKPTKRPRNVKGGRRRKPAKVLPANKDTTGRDNLEADESVGSLTKTKDVKQKSQPPKEVTCEVQCGPINNEEVNQVIDTVEEPAVPNVKTKPSGMGRPTRRSMRGRTSKAETEEQLGETPSKAEMTKQDPNKAAAESPDNPFNSASGEPIQETETSERRKSTRGSKVEMIILETPSSTKEPKVQDTESAEDGATHEQVAVATRSTRGRRGRPAKKEELGIAGKESEEEPKGLEVTVEDVAYKVIDSVDDTVAVDSEPAPGQKRKRGRPKKNTKAPSKPATSKKAKLEIKQEPTSQTIDSVEEDQLISNKPEITEKLSTPDKDRDEEKITVSVCKEDDEEPTYEIIDSVEDDQVQDDIEDNPVPVESTNMEANEQEKNTRFTEGENRETSTSGSTHAKEEDGNQEGPRSLGSDIGASHESTVMEVTEDLPLELLTLDEVGADEALEEPDKDDLERGVRETQEEPRSRSREERRREGGQMTDVDIQELLTLDEVVADDDPEETLGSQRKEAIDEVGVHDSPKEEPESLKPSEELNWNADLIQEGAVGKEEPMVELDSQELLTLDEVVADDAPEELDTKGPQRKEELKENKEELNQDKEEPGCPTSSNQGGWMENEEVGRHESIKEEPESLEPTEELNWTAHLSGEGEAEGEVRKEEPMGELDTQELLTLDEVGGDDAPEQPKAEEPTGKEEPRVEDEPMGRPIREPETLWTVEEKDDEPIVDQTDRPPDHSDEEENNFVMLDETREEQALLDEDVASSSMQQVSTTEAESSSQSEQGSAPSIKVGGKRRKELARPAAKRHRPHSPGLPADFTLPPYSPSTPLGQDFVVPKSGFFCNLCSIFYTNENLARGVHCSSQRHYDNLKKYYLKVKNSPSGASSPSSSTFSSDGV